MPRVQMRTARSAKQDPAEVAEDLMTQLGSFRPVVATLFASRKRDHAALNQAVRDRLPPRCRLLGASTAGEIDRDGMHGGTVVLSGLSGDLEVGIGLGEGLSLDAMTAGLKAAEQAAQQLGLRPEDLDARKHVGVVIDDGFRNKKEELLLGVLERNQSLVLVGGGASDDEWDPEKQSALVHVDGKVATDAAALMVVRTDAPWRALRAHWYEPTGQMLRITKVDRSRFLAVEIDGKPAAERYAEILGLQVDDLDYAKPKGFGAQPAALRVGREYFIRAPWKVNPDRSILFTNLLEEGSEYEIMRRGDMIGLTDRFFRDEVPRRVQSPQAALLFHCSGRHWIAKGMGMEEKLSASFRDAPSFATAGMNVYFETYCGFSINNTLTSLVFGSTE
jgi:hypothetical protein